MYRDPAVRELNLPVPCAGLSLERTDDVVGNPPTVELTGLRLHPLVVDIALDATRIERQAVSKFHERRPRIRILPGNDVSTAISKREVLCQTFPFAHRLAVDGDESVHINV